MAGSNHMAVYNGDSSTYGYSDDGSLWSWYESESSIIIYVKYQVMTLKLIDNCDKDKKRECLIFCEQNGSW